MSINLYEFIKVNHFQVGFLLLKVKVLKGIRAGTHQKNFDPDITGLKISQVSLGDTLWHKAWEHSTQVKKQVRYKDNWLWLWMLRKGKDLHLHSISLLQGTRNNAWNSLFSRNRHVKLRMHCCGTLHWVSNVSRRKWERVIIDDNGGVGSSQSLIHQSKFRVLFLIMIRRERGKMFSSIMKTNLGLRRTQKGMSLFHKASH